MGLMRAAARTAVVADKSRGGLLTFHDNKPEDLIGPPLAQYARSLLGVGDQ